jgi:NAD(P)-dependent dehydrogenase (short-subunit alcohol dehydrogenase family)
MNEATGTPVRELLDLSGQTVLVTGASGNIGAVIAARLAEAGADIIAHFHRNESAAAALVERLGKGRTVRANLADEADIDALFSTVRASMVVHNAAAQPVAKLADMTFADWRHVLASNLDSAFLVTQRAAKSWAAAGTGGALVNIGSIEGLDPAAGHAHYASSKAGLAMLTRAAALEFGPADIRVNCVSPGLIDRNGLAGDWPDGVRRWRERAPLGCLGSPIDVADAVLFLLSPAARWISGANLVVDGGMTAQGHW